MTHRFNLPRSRLWVLVPFAATLAIQLASGVPHPQYFADSEDGSDLEAAVSEILFAPGDDVVSVLHVPVFAVLTWLWCWAATAWTASRRRALVVGTVISAVFGLLNELSQIWAPMRWASAGDAMLNLSGVVVGLVAVALVSGAAD